jgi:hypothetical protein
MLLTRIKYLQHRFVVDVWQLSSPPRGIRPHIRRDIPHKLSRKPSSCTSSVLEDLIDVLAAILVRRLKIMEFLLQVLHVRSQLRRLGCQPLADFDYRAENKPGNGELINIP